MLIDEIIDLLGNTKANLTEALLQTKVLLYQISRKELTDWVNHELNGYPEEADIPGYRVIHTRVLANVANPGRRYTSHPIPLSHLRPDQRKTLERSEIRDSLAVVEEFASSSRKGHLARPIPMEFNGILSVGLGNRYQVEQAWCEINIPDMKGILFQVRSRLLDFLLELRGSLGEPTTESEVKQQALTVDAASMFNNAIFGANTTIVVGHHVSQMVHNETIRGDLEKLTTALKEIGLPGDEIKNLETAVEADKASGKDPSFSGETGHWYTRLLARAAEGGMKIGIDVVTSEVGKCWAVFSALRESDRMQRVVDSNFLQRDELRQFLAASPSNKAVLTDYVAFEAHKGETLQSIYKSMEILCEFPRQIVILKGTGVACGLSGRAAGLQRRLVDQAQTHHFPEYCRDLQAAKAGDLAIQQEILKHGRVATAQMARVQADVGSMPEVFADMAKERWPGESGSGLGGFSA